MRANTHPRRTRLAIHVLLPVLFGLLSNSTVAQSPRRNGIDVTQHLPITEKMKLLRVKTLSNAKHLGLAILMLSNDHGDTYPPAVTTFDAMSALPPYLKSVESSASFRHRKGVNLATAQREFLAQSAFQTLNPKGGRFLYNTALSRVKMTSLESPAQTVLIYESEVWPGGARVVTFADGHAKSVTPQEWETDSKSLKAHYPKAKMIAKP